MTSHIRQLLSLILALVGRIPKPTPHIQYFQILQCCHVQYMGGLRWYIPPPLLLIGRLADCPLWNPAPLLPRAWGTPLCTGVPRRYGGLEVIVPILWMAWPPIWLGTGAGAVVTWATGASQTIFCILGRPGIRTQTEVSMYWHVFQNLLFHSDTDAILQKHIAIMIFIHFPLKSAEFQDRLILKYI